MNRTFKDCLDACHDDGRSFTADTLRFLNGGRVEVNLRRGLRSALKRGEIVRIGYEPSFAMSPNPDGGYPITRPRECKRAFRLRDGGMVQGVGTLVAVYKTNKKKSTQNENETKSENQVEE